ncbi:MAG: S-layer homology domain-containing protein [Oscillospiraceae bacterium]|jgi:spore germination protein YaaH|nr:S-layer homology domain-containing protein [Oscillospiraceae bacterium]
MALPYESLTYLYGGTSPIYTNNINRTRGNLSTVVADYFHIDANGNAALSKTPDKLFIQTLQRQGIRVLAFISNHWDREIARKAMAKREAFASVLAYWVEYYGLDGLDVDIENLNQQDRDNFTDFLRILSELMPHKFLSVAVAANPHRLTVGWHGMYDYPAMGRLCDRVMLMTYDESYEGSEAGPVASRHFIESSIKEALRHIPKEKLVMGIPFYGRYWARLNNNTSIKGKAFTVSNIDTITKHYAARCWYDISNQCARATVTVKESDPVIGLWGGKKMDAGTYDIWYEDERSYAEKIFLCRKYGLQGVGSWALGQEPERIWKGYRLWLGGVPFTDLAGHWAEEAIAELYEREILSGIGSALCAPDARVTRAEICVLLCKLLGVAPRDPSAAPPEVRGHWAAPYLWSAIQYGLMAGDGKHYRPSDPVTRAELAAFCENGLRVPNTIDYSQSFFPDVAPAMWFNNAVITLRVFSVMNGMPDGTFRPHSGATRAEAASVIHNMLDVERRDFLPQARSLDLTAEPYVLEPR